MKLLERAGMYPSRARRADPKIAALYRNSRSEPSPPFAATRHPDPSKNRLR